jgi:hypothetical protein
MSTSMAPKKLMFSHVGWADMRQVRRTTPPARRDERDVGRG